jgi:hypothetical protein
MNSPLPCAEMYRLKRAAHARALALREAELDAAWAALWRGVRRIFKAGRRASPAAARLA